MHDKQINLPAGVTIKVAGVVEIESANDGPESVENVYGAVKYFIKQMNLTEHDLEMAAKVSKGTIKNWKSSKGMNVSSLLKVARVLGVQAHQLLVEPPEH